MITLTAKISLITSDNGTLSEVSTNLSSNNISSNLGAVMGVKREVLNPFIIGKSVIGDGSRIYSKLDYFMGDQVANAYGYF